MNRALFGLLVVLVSTALAHAQAPARDNPTAAKGTASIRGRVVDATGKPLSRVEIRAGGPGNQQANGLTDGSGRYDLNDLPAGTYTVTASKPNYVRTSWGEQRVEGPGKRIPLANGQRLDNINLRLTRAGVITGRVLDEFGDPVTGAAVSAMRYQYIQGQRRLMPSGRTGMTDDIGDFRIYGLSPGQYYVSATLRTFNFSPTDTTDRTGYAPTFYPGTGNVAEAQRLTIAAGQTATSVNLSLLPIQTANISGLALDLDGKPLSTAMVMAMQSGTMGIGSNMAAVRPDGKFTVTGVTPGEYTLRVNGPTGELATATVTVNGADVNDVQLAVARPAMIRGRIAFTESATATGPPKPTAIDLGAWRDWAIGQQVRSPAKIKEDGTFEIPLQAGRVLLRAAPLASGPAGPGVVPWRLNRVLVNDTDVADSGLDVSPGAAIENVVVEMTNHSNEVSGKVTDADGNLVRDVSVIVFAQDAAHWTVQTRHLSVARPGLDDLFHARVLAGDYYAVAMSDVEQGAWTDPDFLRAARELAVKFSIADGESKRIDLPLTPAPVF